MIDMKLKAVLTKTLLGAVSAITMAAGSAVATADAAPAPRLGILGEDIWVMGNHANCHGAIHVGVDTSPKKPKQATVSLTSRGFTGTQPQWNRKPECKINVTIGWWHTALDYREKVVPMTVGPRPQAPVRVDLKNVGQGLQLMSFTTHPNLNKHVAYYVIIP